MIFIAILGHGVVGSGVAEVLHNNAAGIAAKAGEPIRVKRILDLRTFPELPYADNCNLPCEGVSWDLLARSLNALIAEGAELYTDGEVVKAKFPNDDDRDFDGYRYLHGETEAASILDETLEYELDWTKLQEEEGEFDV